MAQFKRSKTERGFDIIEFDDIYGQPASIQKSSLADRDTIWFGAHHPSGSPFRMHLDQDMVKDILPILTKFVETGEI